MSRLLAAIVFVAAAAPTAHARLETTGEEVHALPSSEDDVVLAVAIGYPHAPDKASLRYPGWDAARLVETLGGVYDPDGRHRNRFMLLADFRSTADRDVFGHLAARPPTRKSLLRAVEDLNREIDATRSAGKRTHLFVFYAGHGDVGLGNMGQIYLRPEGAESEVGVGDLFTANDLRQLVLERTRADRVHLIVDACNAYFLMKSRGTSPSSRRARRQGRVGRRFASRLPRVGVLLSTSGVANVYESRVVQGGLFSHVLRSGLAGAADFDRDHTVSYGELEDFIDEAFRGVVNRDLHAPEVYVQPPRLDAEWDAPWSHATVLRLPDPRADGELALFSPAGDARHLVVADARGLRQAEFHADAETAVRLWLTGAGDFRGGALVAYRVEENGARTPILARDPGGGGWRPVPAVESSDLAARGFADDVAHQMFAVSTGLTRVDALADARTRRRRAGDAVEVARDRYFGLRIGAGQAGHAGGVLDGLPTAPELMVGARLEARRWTYGLSGRFRAPRSMAADGSEGSISVYGGGLALTGGHMVPLGPVILHPEIAAGPVLLTQTGVGGTAYGAAVSAGATALVYLPWGTDWAFALHARGGPEVYWNLARVDRDASASRGWAWTIGASFDLELAR